MASSIQIGIVAYNPYWHMQNMLTLVSIVLSALKSFGLFLCLFVCLLTSVVFFSFVCLLLTFHVFRILGKAK